MLLLLVALLGVAVLIYKVIKPRSYWKDRGVAYQKSWPLLGNMAPIIFKTKSFFEVSQDFYDAFPDKRYNGIYQFLRPVLIVRDVNLIKQITVKDFDHFVDHNQVVSEEIDPLMGGNLFQLQGQHWRDMRATLSPAFTGSKMRMMFTLLSECAEQFTQYFQKKGTDTIVLEMRDTFTRFTNDAIASVAFGFKVDSLEDKENEFYLMGREATNFSGLRGLKIFMFNIIPAIMKFLKITFFPKNVADFFRRIVKDTIKQREEQGLIRPDIIHLLMEARKGRLKHEDDKDNNTADSGFAIVQESHVGKTITPQKAKLSDDNITAQALLFFFGGFETSATLMSFIAYELAVNPEIQEKLQAEIDDTLQQYNGKITYEGLLGMKYLDMVVSETLRKWPPGFQLDRVCVKDYEIKPEKPDEKPFIVEKGQYVIIPAVGIHRDPKFFPNPEKFDPERFSADNKHNIEPGAYLPFGAGPRNCIASRFALLENKTLFFHLLSKFDVVVVEKTSIPLKLGTKTLNTTPDGGLWLGLKQRKEVGN